jgi:hypothetical protein
VPLPGVGRFGAGVGEAATGGLIGTSLGVGCAQAVHSENAESGGSGNVSAYLSEHGGHPRRFAPQMLWLAGEGSGSWSPCMTAASKQPRGGCAAKAKARGAGVDERNVGSEAAIPRRQVTRGNRAGSIAPPIETSTLAPNICLTSALPGHCYSQGTSALQVTWQGQC